MRQSVSPVLRTMIQAALLLGLQYMAPAQNVSPPVPARGVNYTTISFSLAQAFNSMVENANFCTATLYIKSSTEYPAGPIQLRTTGQFNLGGTYTDNTSDNSVIRVVGNEIFGEGMIIYPVGWPVNPYMAANIRSPITESFSGGGNRRYRYAKFWDPVTTLEGTGFAYTLMGKFGSFQSRAGLGFRQVRGDRHTFLTDDLQTPAVEKYMAQTGIEHSSDLYLTIDTTTTCTARLALFSAFDELDVWNARFEGTVQFQFWRFLAFEWRLQITHDIQQTRRTQFLHTLTFGLTHTFF